MPASGQPAIHKALSLSPLASNRAAGNAEAVRALVALQENGHGIAVKKGSGW